MNNPTATVIRSNDTVLGDSFQLQIAQCERSSQLSQQSTAETTPQVRIAENTDEHVVLEVTCPCGRKSYVKCEYANT